MQPGFVPGKARFWGLFLMYTLRTAHCKPWCRCLPCHRTEGAPALLWQSPQCVRSGLLNPLTTTTGWKEREWPSPTTAPPTRQAKECSWGNTQRPQTWWSCWSRLGPWQKWSVWWSQSPHPRALPQSRCWARTQEAHPHPPHWCGRWWCHGRDPGSGTASPGGSWHPLLSGCSFSCSQNLKAEGEKRIYHQAHWAISLLLLISSATKTNICRCRKSFGRQ